MCFLIEKIVYMNLLWMSDTCIFADSFDTEQLVECMGKLKGGQSVNVPIYDFKSHRRCSESFRKVCHQADNSNILIPCKGSPY